MVLMPLLSRLLTLLVILTMPLFLFFFQAEDGIRLHCVTGVQTCALPIYPAQTGQALADPANDSPAKLAKAVRLNGVLRHLDALQGHRHRQRRPRGRTSWIPGFGEL